MRRIRILSLALAIGTTLASFAHSQNPTVSQLKAAFVVNFAKFVDWPSAETLDAPFTFAVIGSDDLFRDLQTETAGKQVKSRPVTIVQVQASEPIPPNVAVLFIGSNAGPELAAILGACSKRPILTVGDSESFTNNGGMIQLIQEGPFIRFDIHEGNLGQSHLVASSKLLRLAHKVLK